MPYREESFAILMINAWELLLKARIMQQNGGKASCLYVRQAKTKKNGTPSKVKIAKTTRSGLPYTIGLVEACKIVSTYQKNGIDVTCVENIEALLEIRDCATHFIVQTPNLSRMLIEISLAAVRNYVIAIQKWFKVSFADLNVASIPMSFDLDQNSLDAVAKKPTPAVARFLAHMNAIEAKASGQISDFALTVKVEFNLSKKKVDGAVNALIVGPNDGPQLTVSVHTDGVPPGFDWDYSELNARLQKRYSNFVQNHAYHTLRKSLEKDPKLCVERYLDPIKKTSSRKLFYNPNILKKFDAVYITK
jgi:hypothetical protein